MFLISHGAFDIKYWTRRAYHGINLPEGVSIRGLSKKARIVTQRVPFGELYEISELPLPVQLTENAESIPPGVFSFSPVFRAVCDVRP